LEVPLTKKSVARAYRLSEPARSKSLSTFWNFQPGVVVGSNTGGGVQVHGSRDRAFNFTLDGIDINDSTAGGSNFTPLRPNPESIQEFQIITSNPNG
jgi:hypothetical protein